ncbi:MAG: hypothetical protein L3J39_10595 [Verrucomicrobiales bacterium]|nr:hypothetical protein [Verrucomicrobiales bacterium]
MGASGYQVVVYSMRLDAAEDLAMILPIPVIANSSEEVLKFLDFSAYPGFFDDVDKNFPEPKSYSRDGADPFGSDSAPDLAVKKVGSFDASFVPRVEDFSRLDERFRLSGEVWKKLPAYADYGFVVFKLSKGKRLVHPMAFAFPSRDRSHITFPTVHIHDGKVHRNAEFDHSLYCQSPSTEAGMKWRESAYLSSYYIKCSKTSGVIRPKLHIFKKTLKGKLKNEDVTVQASV